MRIIRKWDIASLKQAIENRGEKDDASHEARISPAIVAALIMESIEHDKHGHAVIAGDRAMASRILCLEGPSAVGKSTLAAALARAWGAEIVAELSAGPPPSHDAARWFVGQHVARWHRARALASRAPFVVLDGDPFKGIWYDWIYAADGWPGVEAIAALYREHVRHDTLAFPDLYVLLRATEAQLRQRRSGDPTRTRRNFEKHLALIGPQRRYFEAVNDAVPGRVLFLETTERDTLVPAVRDAVTALGSGRMDGTQLLETLVAWVHTQHAPEPP